MRPERQSALTLGALAVIAALVGFAILEIHGVEKRLAVQGQQIRALGEATDRLASQGVRVAGAGAASPSVGDETPAHVLHPEVPNFLKPKDKHWPAPGATRDGTLTRDWPWGDPKGFNSLLESAAELQDEIEAYTALPIADRNVWTNPEEWHGELATRIEITDDFKEFSIYLRRGVKWHPPPNVNLDDPKHAWLRERHEVTARDLVFTLDMIINPQVENGALKNYYIGLESYKAVDDYTFVVRWKKKEYLNIGNTIGLFPMPEFLFSREEDGRPIPKESLGLRFNQHWYNNKGYVGAGPYRMASYEPGSRIRLVRNEEFFGDKPAIREIVYPIYTDPQQTVLKLKAHEINAGILMPGQYREEVLQYEHAKSTPAGSPFLDGRIHCEKVPKFGYYYLGWNAERPIFADKRVRQAMTMALNRTALIESVFAGLGQLSIGPFQPGSQYNDPDVRPIPFDLDGARKLLAEAGFRDTDGDGIVDKELHPGDGKRAPFEFTMLTYGSRKEWSALTNVFKEDLLKIGVKMNIETAEWSLMQKRMEEKRFDAYTGGWGTVWDVDLYQIWHSSQADVPKGSNRVGFRNKEADGIIEKVRVTFDQEERTRLFRAFHRIVNDEQPYTFVIARTEPLCMWNDVKDVIFSKVRPAINTLPWSVARGTN